MYTNSSSSRAHRRDAINQKPLCVRLTCVGGLSPGAAFAGCFSIKYTYISSQHIHLDLVYSSPPVALETKLVPDQCVCRTTRTRHTHATSIVGTHRIARHPNPILRSRTKPHLALKCVRWAAWPPQFSVCCNYARASVKPKQLRGICPPCRPRWEGAKI